MSGGFLQDYVISGKKKTILKIGKLFLSTFFMLRDRYFHLTDGENESQKC